MHPEVAKAHNQSGLEYILRAEDRVSAWFEAITTNQPRKVHIDQIYRIKTGAIGEVREHLFWHRTVTSNDEYGNLKTLSTMEGKFDLPLFEYQYDQITKRKKSIGINGFEEKYDTPFTTERLLADSQMIAKSIQRVVVLDSRHGQLSQPTPTTSEVEPS